MAKISLSDSDIQCIERWLGIDHVSKGVKCPFEAPYFCIQIRRLDDGTFEHKSVHPDPICEQFFREFGSSDRCPCIITDTKAVAAWAKELLERGWYEVKDEA